MNLHAEEKRFTELTENIFELMVEKEDEFDGKFSKDFFYNNDIEELTDIFYDFYDYFQGHDVSINNEIITSMLRHFFRQKLGLYKLLGTVRLVKEVEVEQDQNSFIRNFKQRLEEELSMLRRNISVMNKEKQLKAIADINKLEIVRNGTLFSNEFSTLYNNYSDAHDMKTSKIFATLFGADNYITTTYSNLIQNSMLKETVYISISPLDFLTMSENSYEWKSCLRIRGEWGGGSQSYIMDDSTVISFIGKYRESFIGLDKKWRQLIYLQLDNEYLNIAQSRQYPSTIKTIEEETRRILFGQINNFVGENLSYTLLEDTAIEFHEERNACHYFDLKNSHYGAYAENEKFTELTGMSQIGEIGFCLSCGDTMDTETQQSGYVCSNCEY